MRRRKFRVVEGMYTQNWGSTYRFYVIRGTRRMLVVHDGGAA